jgi:hypothetical protein
VANARYYDVQIDTVPPSGPSSSQTLSVTKVKLDLTGYTSGTQVTVCVRAVGGKGAGAFCNALTITAP